MKSAFQAIKQAGLGLIDRKDSSLAKAVERIRILGPDATCTSPCVSIHQKLTTFDSTNPVPLHVATDLVYHIWGDVATEGCRGSLELNTLVMDPVTFSF